MKTKTLENSQQGEILWIDDDPDVLQSFGTIWRSLGFSVVGRTSGYLGIEEIQENPLKYSMVFLDLEMPEMNGVECYLEIRKLNPHLPITIVSANLSDPIWKTKMDIISEERHLQEKPFGTIHNNDFKEFVSSIVKRMAQYDSLPYSISLDEFVKMLDYEKDRLYRQVYVQSQNLVGKHFYESSDDEWIVIGGSPCKVICSGNSSNEPSLRGLRLISDELNDGKMIYDFVRPIIGRLSRMSKNEEIKVLRHTVYSGSVLRADAEYVTIQCRSEAFPKLEFERRFSRQIFEQLEPLNPDDPFEIAIIESPLRVTIQLKKAKLREQPLLIEVDDLYGSSLFPLEQS